MGTRGKDATKWQPGLRVELDLSPEEAMLVSIALSNFRDHWTATDRDRMMCTMLRAKIQTKVQPAISLRSESRMKHKD
jgi:hypothetical protein